MVIHSQGYLTQTLYLTKKETTPTLQHLFIELVFKADSFTSFTANSLINHNLSHQMY